MSLRRRLWDAGYAMAEPFIEMHPSEKVLVISLLAVLMYLRIASWVGLDSRVVVGTAIGVLLSLATFPIWLSSCRNEP